jgi:hypothetical protein
MITINPIEHMSVIDAITSQFLTNCDNKLFSRVYSRIDNTIECTLLKENLRQARSISQQGFKNSLAVLIPKERLSLVFEESETLNYTGDPPSTLLKHKINGVFATTPESSIDSESVSRRPRQRQRTSGIVVFSVYQQAASLISTKQHGDENPQSAPEAKKPETTKQNVNATVQSAVEKTNDLFGKLSERVEQKINNMIEKEDSHAKTIETLNNRLQTLEGNVQQTQASISTLQSGIDESISQKFAQNIAVYTNTFETRLADQLVNTANLLESKNEQRLNLFRQEHQQFVMEYRAAQTKQEK